MTNAQITIPIIISIILLIGISLAIYLSAINTPQAQRPLQTTALTKPINEYITSCLAIAARNALTTIGIQGGTLYQHQGGITPDPTPQQHGTNYATIGNNYVTYLIQIPQENINNLFSSQPPLYPWETFPILNGQYTTTGYFGINTIPPLYNTSPNSIQEQLQTAISKKTQECTDWKNFESQGLTISTGEPHTTMLIASNITQLSTEETISFTLNWPIEITTGTTTSTLNEFITTINIPYGRMYYTIRKIIDQEVQNISTEPHTEPNSTTIIYTTKNILPNDDLITIQFPTHTINEKPYTFQLLRHNRPPALHYIDPTQIENTTWHAGIKLNVKNNTLTLNDPCPEPNTPKKITLTTSDPDNDTITYSLLPSNPAQYNTPTGNKPPYELRITANDGQYEDSQTLRLTLTCCPEGCP